MTPQCSYCGAPAAFKLSVRGRVQLRTCSAHADLPALDPSHGLAETIARGAYPALDPLLGTEAKPSTEPAR